MVTVYATAQDAALLTAIDALPAHGAHVAVRVVPHSFRQLNDLAIRIGNDGAALRPPARPDGRASLNIVRLNRTPAHIMAGAHAGPAAGRPCRPGHARSMMEL
jgi:hypothetical protein